MSRAAAETAGPGFDGDDGGLAVAAGIGDDGGGAEEDTGHAAGQGQQGGLGEELGADLAAGGAEGAAQADFLTAFQHGDDHDVGDTDGTDEEGDGAEAEEQGVEGTFGVGLRGECSRRLGDGDVVRGFPGRPGAPSRLSTAVVAAWLSGVVRT